MKCILQEARRRQKTCRVCGDHATGYNFNVITCESCKAFFRRNAGLSCYEFKCPYSEDCEINAVSRRFCQKCRLRKCFAVILLKLGFKVHTMIFSNCDEEKIHD
ncbi:unnamed protein product [Cylicostephanus goldi]|uniref:Nuclear receptor domain-containing protein n=1 Tax=Cylicostephanus goldi TaxID=71465 RepID=A0A3P6RG04_CYLGO|nr:unnamed protein product [Cylicostephanus goldi]